jgi:hypothetical protein
MFGNGSQILRRSHPNLETTETPVGESCISCEEPILAGEQGFIDAGGQPSHYECFMRAVIGSVEHQMKGPHGCDRTCQDADGLTKRQAARAAVRYWEKKTLPQYRDRLESDGDK